MNGEQVQSYSDSEHIKESVKAEGSSGIGDEEVFLNNLFDLRGACSYKSSLSLIDVSSCLGLMVILVDT